MHDIRSLGMCLGAGLGALALVVGSPAPARSDGPPPGLSAVASLSQARGVAGDWRERLSDADLDRRERAYDEALVQARRDPALVQTLRAWRDGSGEEVPRELSWTSRLLLRELDAGAALNAWPGGPRALPGGLGAWPGHLLEMPDVEQLLRDLDGLGALPPGGAAAREQSESFRLEVGPDGARCTVTAEEDGERVERTYEAPSLEELLGLHPELRERVQLGGGAWAPSVFPDWHGLRPRDLSERWRRMLGSRPPRTDVLGVVVRALPEDRARHLELEEGVGLLVERVEPGTLADALGVRRGEVLVELNGRPLRAAEDVARALAERAEDGDLRLVLRDRGGQERERVWKPQSAAPPIEPDPLGVRRF